MNGIREYYSSRTQLYAMNVNRIDRKHYKFPIRNCVPLFYIYAQLLLLN